jgi:methyl-accepting chemotaxis protein
MGQKRNSFKIFIKKKLQIKFALFVGCFVLLSCLLLWGSVELLLYLYLRQDLNVAIMGKYFQDLHFQVVYFFFWETVVATAGSFFMALLYSRRLVGPIYRIEEELRRCAAEGVVTDREVRIRSNDEFQELCQALNRLLMGNKQ